MCDLRAMAKIRNWVKTEERKKSIALGRDLLEKEFKKHHLKFGQISKSSEMQEIFKELHTESLEDLLAFVGYGRVSPKHVVHHFLPEEEVKKDEPVDKTRKKVRRRNRSACRWLGSRTSWSGLGSVAIRSPEMRSSVIFRGERNHRSYGQLHPCA